MSKIYNFKDEHANELFVRFIMNASEESFSTPEDFCILLESAFYFYCDFLIHKRVVIFNDHKKEFMMLCKGFFESIPQLAPLEKYSEQLFKLHKTHFSKTNATGCICYNKTLTHVLVVHHQIKPEEFSFPKGKMSKNESYIEAAVRETLEETGLDVTKYIDENNFIEYSRKGKSNVRLFNIIGLSISSHLISPSPLEICYVRWIKINHIGKENKYSPDSVTKNVILPKIIDFVEKQKYHK